MEKRKDCWDKKKRQKNGAKKKKQQRYKISAALNIFIFQGKVFVSFSSGSFSYFNIAIYLLREAQMERTCSASFGSWKFVGQLLLTYYILFKSKYKDLIMSSSIVMILSICSYTTTFKTVRNNYLVISFETAFIFFIFFIFYIELSLKSIPPEVYFHVLVYAPRNKKRYKEIILKRFVNETFVFFF